MNKSRELLPALTAVCLALAVSMTHAAPVSFSVSAATFTLGAGYGVDVKNDKKDKDEDHDENGGKLLDVEFLPVASFAGVNFSFDSLESGSIFNVGTVNFREPNTGSGDNRGISSNEALAALGISVSLTLVDFGMAVVSGVGQAFAGPIGDSPEAVDYMLTGKTPRDVDFGDAGIFRITLNSLSFSNVGIQTLTATVTRLADTAAPVTPVPEPATLALATIALAGIGASRRRRPA